MSEKGRKRNQPLTNSPWTYLQTNLVYKLYVYKQDTFSCTRFLDTFIVGILVIMFV